MLKSLRLSIAVGVLALGLPFGLMTTSANAATITSASAQQPTWCGWRPANDSGQDAHVWLILVSIGRDLPAIIVDFKPNVICRGVSSICKDEIPVPRRLHTSRSSPKAFGRFHSRPYFGDTSRRTHLQLTTR